MKALLDSSVYIRGWHDPDFFESYASLVAPIRPQTFASTVVIGECWAGARDRIGRRLVQMVFNPFEAAGRIVTPARRDWKEAGKLLAIILEKRPALRNKLGALWHDVMIVFSALRIGATLYTLNGKDFELIREYKQFSMYLL